MPSVNANLWGRSIDCTGLDDPWGEPPEHLYALTKTGPDCPNEPAYVELAFEQGTPVAINGVTMPLVDLIVSLRTIAGAHGVGRLDLVETGPAGRSRKVYEAPAAVVLHTGHRELTKLAASRDLDRFARQVRVHYADLICHGLWFSPFREALDAFVTKCRNGSPARSASSSSRAPVGRPAESPPPCARRRPTIADRSPPRIDDALPTTDDFSPLVWPVRHRSRRRRL